MKGSVHGERGPTGWLGLFLGAMWVSPETIKNVSPQWTIVPMVALGPADDLHMGLGCCSCFVDFSSACFGQEKVLGLGDVGKGGRAGLCGFRRFILVVTRKMAQETPVLGLGLGRSSGLMSPFRTCLCHLFARFTFSSPQTGREIIP